MREIRVDDIGRLGYQQLSMVRFANPISAYFIESEKPEDAVAYWIPYTINAKTGYTYVCYVKDGISPGN